VALRVPVFRDPQIRGLYAFDMDGKLLWEKDFGDKRMRNQFGEGSTPSLYRNRLVIVWDHIGGQSFVAVLDKKTGQEIWRNTLDDGFDASPALVDKEMFLRGYRYLYSIAAPQ
jgi:outer membrane protein assembly factor BamB